MSETREAYDVSERPVARNPGASVPKPSMGPSAQLADAYKDAYEWALRRLAEAEEDLARIHAQLADARSETDRLRHAIRNPAVTRSGGDDASRP